MIESGLLKEEEQRFLLDLARITLAEYLERGTAPRLAEIPSTEHLMERRSCFVTYHIKDELRGCIGSITPSRPLYEEVMDKAILAAQDPRFDPIGVDELSDLEIEITVLSPLFRISEIKQFIPGKHGIVLKKDNKQAVFLPQVAPEQGWGREETLGNLALKAGLPEDAWKSECSMQIFTAQIITTNHSHGQQSK